MKKENLPHFSGYFVSAEGINAYQKKDYALAASKLTASLEMYNDQWKHLTENFYLGMSYWHLNRKTEAIPFLLLIEDEFDSTGKIDPVFRPAFETLLTYYREKKDAEKQIIYLSKLIKLNNLYEKQYK